MPHDVSDEILHGEGLFQVAGDIRDPLPDAFHGLVRILGLIDLEHAGQVGHFRREEERAVVQNPVLLDGLGIARKFPPVDD